MSLTINGSLEQVAVMLLPKPFSATRSFKEQIYQFTSHLGQLQKPSGTSSNGGSRHVRCHEHVQVSHRRISPPSAQTSQTELCKGSGTGSSFLPLKKYCTKVICYQ